MRWDYWIKMYIEDQCLARGLRSSTIAAYQSTLQAFRIYAQFRLGNPDPDQISTRNVTEYVMYLREERHNGVCAVNRHVVVLKNFYRAAVVRDELAPRDNPMKRLGLLKGPPKKLPEVLSEEEVARLMNAPNQKTVIGLRDRAIVTLLYSTGIRAQECASLTDANVDLVERMIKVVGKGGHERTIPFTDKVGKVLAQYRLVRGHMKRCDAFFRSRNGGGMSRNSVYERVRTNAQKARIQKRVSPHRLRHTFATHLVRMGEEIRTVQELLGHKWITSTQIYLHTTARELREAAERHPVGRLIGRIENLLPNIKLPFQEPRKLAFA